MPIPSSVTRAYDYSTWQAANPLAPLPAGRIETDFDNLCAYTLQLTGYLNNATLGGELPVTGGTMLGPLILSASPTVPLGAATKAYVDSVVLAGGLPTTGGTMTGFITLHANPTAANHAANKAYVDSVVIAGGLPIGGGTLTGNLTVNAANAALTLRKAAGGQVARVTGQTGAVLRWTLDLGDTTAEAGANAGSNFTLASYSDAGAFLRSPLTINRATGNATFAAAAAFVGEVTTPTLRGGPFDAGTLRLWNSSSSVNFAYDATWGSLYLRINETVQQRIIYSNNFYTFEPYTYGATASILFRGTDASLPLIFIDTFSDERLKANIRPAAGDALAKLLSIQVSDFEWNQDGLLNQGAEPGGPYASVSMGLIAQDVEREFPGQVADVPARLASGETTTRKKIRNADLVPALIRAIQQLEARVRYLETHT